MTTINDTPVLHLLRLEGAATFIAGLAGYFALGGNWYLLALLALLPDVAMVGYAFGPKVGARFYNASHTYLLPALIGGLGFATFPALLPVACVWIAHIGIDRALGYGLKSETAFGVTHLGRIGRA